MKKKRWKVWLPLLLTLVIAGAIAATVSQLHGQADLPQAHYRVFVNDKVVDWYAKRSTDSLMLPFLALAESLGIPADWQNETIAHLSFAGRTWVFNTKDGSLKQLGTNSDMLLPPPGSIGGKRTEAVERDVYIDTGSLGFFLTEYMGARINEIDEAQRVVRITHNQKVH